MWRAVICDLDKSRSGGVVQGGLLGEGSREGGGE